MQEEIEERIIAQIPNAQVKVALDGNKALIEVTSDHFDGMGRVQRQQSIYGCIQDYIADGRLHAVTIKVDTPD
jgi:acid stress-induced BolA-like protein IbaG/YrbA